MKSFEQSVGTSILSKKNEDLIYSDLRSRICIVFSAQQKDFINHCKLINYELPHENVLFTLPCAKTDNPNWLVAEPSSKDTLHANSI